MQIGQDVFEGAHELDVNIAAQAGIEAALHADFSAAPIPGFNGLLDNVIHAKRIGFAVALLAAEFAEFARRITHIGKVDIADFDVGHAVADLPLAQGVSRGHERHEVEALRAK